MRSGPGHIMEIYTTPSTADEDDPFHVMQLLTTLYKRRRTESGHGALKIRVTILSSAFCISCQQLTCHLRRTRSRLTPSTTPQTHPKLQKGLACLAPIPCSPVLAEHNHDSTQSGIFTRGSLSTLCQSPLLILQTKVP